MRKLNSEDKQYLERIEKLLFEEKENSGFMTFIDFVNNKYKKKISKSFRSKKFTTWDDYALWLYYVYCQKNNGFYYSKLEDDLKEYSDIQTKDKEEAYDGFFYLKDEVPNKW